MASNIPGGGEQGERFASATVPRLPPSRSLSAPRARQHPAPGARAHLVPDPTSTYGPMSPTGVTVPPRACTPLLLLVDLVLSASTPSSNLSLMHSWDAYLPAVPHFLPSPPPPRPAPESTPLVRHPRSTGCGTLLHNGATMAHIWSAPLAGAVSGQIEAPLDAWTTPPPPTLPRPSPSPSPGTQTTHARGTELPPPTHAPAAFALIVATLVPLHYIHAGHNLQTTRPALKLCAPAQQRLALARRAAPARCMLQRPSARTLPPLCPSVRTLPPLRPSVCTLPPLHPYVCTLLPRRPSVRTVPPPSHSSRPHPSPSAPCARRSGAFRFVDVLHVATSPRAPAAFVLLATMPVPFRCVCAARPTHGQRCRADGLRTPSARHARLSACLQRVVLSSLTAAVCRMRARRSAARTGLAWGRDASRAEPLAQGLLLRG
ncbi:hypothetical protein DFH07DRAFT_951285 [Mycena maculata]|uniref:Uncharacterized protein n=1 Tax=Mycena maculata TaxID=230809 RepID=A0AAD7K6A4_9AGAR|nr:hypothetical protein DFH07DRAFT_951285 [Mycena maculata]